MTTRLLYITVICPIYFLYVIEPTKESRKHNEKEGANKPNIYFIGQLPARKNITD